MTRMQALAELAGRVLISAIFLASGAGKIAAPPPP